MTDTDDPRTPADEAEPASPWRADTFDRWLAALDPTDEDAAIDADLGPVPVPGLGADGAEPGPDPDDDRDPWAGLHLDVVDLSSDQREYLTWHEHQPPVSRLRGADADDGSE